jgi:hypothetical protein
MKEYYVDQNSWGEFLISEGISDLVDNNKNIDIKSDDLFVEFSIDDFKIRKNLEKFSNRKKTKLAFLLDKKNLHYFFNSKKLSCILYYCNKEILMIDNSTFSFSFKSKKENSSLCLAKVTFS